MLPTDIVTILEDISVHLLKNWIHLDETADG